MRICHKILVILLILFLPSLGFSATYYIDHSASNDSANGTTKLTPWKRCPGMVGFAGSYSHSAGDIFIFKGGETWTSTELPLTIGYSGSAGNIDTYTIDATWYTGGSWSQPVFDGENTDTILVSISNHDYLTFNNLKFYNITHSDSAIMDIESDCDHVTVQNCTFTCTQAGTACLYISANSTHTISNLLIDTCDLQGYGAANVVFIHTNWGTVNGIEIKNCTIHHSTNYETQQDDGIHIQNTLGTDTMSNISIYNNTFYENITKAHIIIEGSNENTYIYGNLFYGKMDIGAIELENTDVGQGAVKNLRIYNNIFRDLVWATAPYQSWSVISLKHQNQTGSTTSYIVNNTFVGTKVANEKMIWFMTLDSSNVIVENNIIVDSTTAIRKESDATPGTITTNLYYDNTTNNDGVTDANPIIGDPLFLNEAGDDYHLTIGSPAIDVAVVLNSLFTVDKDNITRGSAWDIGAYEYIPPGSNSISIGGGSQSIAIGGGSQTISW